MIFLATPDCQDSLASNISIALKKKHPYQLAPLLEHALEHHPLHPPWHSLVQPPKQPVLHEPVHPVHPAVHPVQPVQPPEQPKQVTVHLPKHVVSHPIATFDVSFATRGIWETTNKPKKGRVDLAAFLKNSLLVFNSCFFI